MKKIILIILFLYTFKIPFKKIKMYKIVFKNLRKKLNVNHKILLNFWEISCNILDKSINKINLNIVKAIAKDLNHRSILDSFKLFGKFFNYQCRYLFNRLKNKSITKTKVNPDSKILSLCENKRNQNFIKEYYENEKEYCFNTLIYSKNNYIIKSGSYKAILDDKWDRIILKDTNDIFLCQINEVSDLKNERLHHKLILIYKNNNNYINCHQVEHFNLLNNKIPGDVILISINLEKIFKS